VLIATDGDFNVGITDFEDLLELIKAQRKTGIGLTTLGFGAGNYNDHLMEQLADAGNGNHAYIDTLSEARKVLVDQLTSTLHTVASDVKIQIEFNASVVSEYRLVGYENRMLAQEDFNNDKVDAGDIGAGHSVTALYELALVGGPHSVEPLRYGTTAAPTPSDLSAELAFLKLRYKAPGSASSTAIEHAIERSTMHSSLDAASENLRFSAAVAGFGQVLRGNETLGDFDFNDVLSLASAAKGNDPYGYRGEFIDLVRTAQALAQL